MIFCMILIITGVRAQDMPYTNQTEAGLLLGTGVVPAFTVQMFNGVRINKWNVEAGITSGIDIYDQITILVDHIKVILQKAIKLGGSTLRDFTVADGQTGYFQQTLNVYGRQGEACPNCDTVLENIKLNGRASVYCPHCQPII